MGKFCVWFLYVDIFWWLCGSVIWLIKCVENDGFDCSNFVIFRKELSFMLYVLVVDDDYDLVVLLCDLIVGE